MSHGGIYMPGLYFGFKNETSEFGITDYSPFKIERTEKGKSLLEFPNDYVVIDIETTGLSPEWDDIIELSALKISDGEICNRFTTLIRPENPSTDENGQTIYVDDFITELTGINNDMLKTAPLFMDVADSFINFIGDSIIVGHNVNFDINFIYDNLFINFEKVFSNNFCDLLRISRKIFPDLPNHKLKTLANAFGIDVNTEHRGMADCLTTFKCFEYCRKCCVENNIDISLLKANKIDLRDIKAETTVFDDTHPLYGKVCVFTGKLEYMKRTEAAQLVVNIGGICENGVTKRTNYLILGNNDYSSSIKDGKSNKQKKAEALILQGYDLQIMPENVFYDMIQYEM